MIVIVLFQTFFQGCELHNDSAQTALNNQANTLLNGTTPSFTENAAISGEQKDVDTQKATSQVQINESTLFGEKCSSDSNPLHSLTDVSESSSDKVSSLKTNFLKEKKHIEESKEPEDFDFDALFAASKASMKKAAAAERCNTDSTTQANNTSFDNQRKQQNSKIDLDALLAASREHIKNHAADKKSAGLSETEMVSNVEKVDPNSSLSASGKEESVVQAVSNSDGFKRKKKSLRSPPENEVNKQVCCLIAVLF